MTNPTPQSNNQSVIVGDRDDLTHKLKVNADGSINVNTGGGGGAQAVNLTEVGGAAVALGAATSAASIPVVIASDQAAFPMAPGPVTLTERSGNMTAGGTSQQMMAANTARKYLEIQNPLTLTGQNIAAAESLFIRFGTSGAAPAGVNNGTSFELPPGSSFVAESSDIMTQAVQVNAATTSHRWIAVEG